ncbi:MAG TPA: hypothetical protein DDY34_02450 [Bacteroidales bacterium]|nr:hypothetical protein [Bacteroidales bacterium]
MVITLKIAIFAEYYYSKLIPHTSQLIIMASVRELKKDIDYLVFEVISDCFVFQGIHPDHKSEELSAVINDAVNLRNDLIARVNNPDGKDNPKIVKSYYKSVSKDLLTGVDNLFTRLSKLTKKQ